MVLVAWIRKCFQFNSGFNSKNDRIVLEEVNREGKDFGVTLAWFPVINLNKFVTTGAWGLVVFVHNSTFEPNEGVFIEAGKMTYISKENNWRMQVLFYSLWWHENRCKTVFKFERFRLFRRELW